MDPRMTLHARIHRHIVDVDLEIPMDAVTVLFGPSGAGKTTILRAIAGLDHLDDGEIRVGAETWNDGSRITVPARHRKVGYLFQDHALFPHLSVRANVGFGLRRGAQRDIDVRDAMAIANAAHLAETKVLDLSGGEAQRVALARSLAAHPRLLLLDEPLSALDGPTRMSMRTDLRTLLATQRLPAVVVTHDRAEALALGDHIYVLVDGQVRQRGTPAAVFDRPADPSVARVLGVETAAEGIVGDVRSGVIDVTIGAQHVTASAPEDLHVETGDRVLVCIRAEDIALSVGTDHARTSQRNRLAATVEAIALDGPLVRVDLDAGFGLTAYITRPALEDLELAPGSPVEAIFKSQAVHLIKR
jgi:molybdate transport system ATP-binding protein